jgi:hypothetical protein
MTARTNTTERIGTTKKTKALATLVCGPTYVYLLQRKHRDYCPERSPLLEARLSAGGIHLLEKR